MTSLPPCCAAFFLAVNAWAQPAPFAAKFALGPHTLLYSETSGNGFEPGATDNAYYFSVRVPEEGNYKVSAGRLDKVLSVIRPGDYLLIQMGHNDQKEKGDGVGAFTTYKADLEHFVSAARAHGATPVLITSVQRLNFDAAGKIVNSLGDYPEAVRRVAREQNVALIDLNAMSKPFYEALGPRDAHLAFAPNDATHHNDYGSYQLAKCVVEGIRKAVPSLAKHLVETPPFDPAPPDPLAEFALPPDPAPLSSTKPQGQL